MLTDILIYAALFVAGGVAALKVIAPRTKNTVDDSILHYGEEAEKVLASLGVKLPDHVELKAVSVATKTPA